MSLCVRVLKVAGAGFVATVLPPEKGDKLNEI